MLTRSFSTKSPGGVAPHTTPLSSIPAFFVHCLKMGVKVDDYLSLISESHLILALGQPTKFQTYSTNGLSETPSVTVR